MKFREDMMKKCKMRDLCILSECFFEIYIRYPVPGTRILCRNMCGGAVRCSNAFGDRAYEYSRATLEYPNIL